MQRGNSALEIRRLTAVAGDIFRRLQDEETQKKIAQADVELRRRLLGKDVGRNSGDGDKGGANDAGDNGGGEG